MDEMNVMATEAMATANENTEVIVPAEAENKHGSTAVKVAAIGGSVVGVAGIGLLAHRLIKHFKKPKTEQAATETVSAASVIDGMTEEELAAFEAVIEAEKAKRTAVAALENVKKNETEATTTGETETTGETAKTEENKTEETTGETEKTEEKTEEEKTEKPKTKGKK